MLKACLLRGTKVVYIFCYASTIKVSRCENVHISEGFDLPVMLNDCKSLAFFVASADKRVSYLQDDRASQIRSFPWNVKKTNETEVIFNTQKHEISRRGKTCKHWRAPHNSIKGCSNSGSMLALCNTSSTNIPLYRHDIFERMLQLAAVMFLFLSSFTDCKMHRIRFTFPEIHHRPVIFQTLVRKRQKTRGKKAGDLVSRRRGTAAAMWCHLVTRYSHRLIQPFIARLKYIIIQNDEMSWIKRDMKAVSRE